MKNTELKAIEHVSKLLKSIQTYKIYSVTSDKLNEYKMGKDERIDTLNVLQEETAVINEQVRECEDWLAVIIKDLKEANAKST